MSIDSFTVHNLQQLQLAVRMGGFLRLKHLRLMTPSGIGGSRTVSRIISEELARTDSGLQLYSWQLAHEEGPFSSCFILSTHFYDHCADRLFVRAHVYNTALSLCRRGKPGVDAIAHTVLSVIPYSNLGANPHCVSNALKTRSGVCQAIAIYMCQLLLRCGYAAVVRVGQINGNAHAWNEVYMNNSWRRLDLCVQGNAQQYIQYMDNSPVSSAEQYRQMSMSLEREVEVHKGRTTVNGMPLPFFIADAKKICPTCFVQCFNGAYQREGAHLTLALGNTVRSVPLNTLESGRNRLPMMSIGSFADLFEIPFVNNRLLFQEGL